MREIEASAFATPCQGVAGLFGGPAFDTGAGAVRALRQCLETLVSRDTLQPQTVYGSVQKHSCPETRESPGGFKCHVSQAARTPIGRLCCPRRAWPRSVGFGT